MVAKCFQSADIILDEAGQRFIIRGRNTGGQPLLIGGRQQPGIDIKDHFRGIVPFPEDGQPALIVAQEIPGRALGQLGFFGDRGFGRLGDGGGIRRFLHSRFRWRDAAGEKRQNQPQQQGGDGNRQGKYNPTGHGEVSFPFFSAVVWAFWGGIVRTERKFKK